MSDLEVFGPVVVATQVGDAVTKNLQKWIPAYLGWIDRQVGATGLPLPVPQSYVVTDDPDHWPEDQPPAVVIVVPGTDGQPKQDGQRLYRAEWVVHIATFVTASDRASTERLAKYYAAAVRQLMIQKVGPGGLADYLPSVAGTQWRGEKYDVKVQDRAQRTLGSSVVSICIDVRQTARAWGGPATPPQDPSQVPADWPVATKVTTKFTP